MHLPTRNRLIGARTALILDQPFFGVLALRLELVEDPTAPTAWVDGRSLGYNPAFIAECSPAELRAVLCHEVLHCALGHPWRRDLRDPERWNEAADRAINPTLRDSGFSLPDGCLFELEPSHKGKSAEWIFDRLPPPQPRPPSGGGSQAGQGPPGPASAPPPAGTPGDAPGIQQPTKAPPGPASAPPGAAAPEHAPSPSGPPERGSAPRSLGEVRDAPADVPGAATPMPTETEWQQAVQQAAVAARQQGRLPGNVERVVQSTATSRIDWRSALRRFVQERAAADYSWVRPNPRYLASGMYLPALRSEEMGRIAVAIDTSGSIDGVLLAQFQGELQGIVDELQPREVHVLYADARVAREETFVRGEPLTFHPAGGGGTNFCPVFERIAAGDEAPVCLVYLTDLYGRFPDKEPEVPTLWVTGRGQTQVPQVPFGEVVSAG